MNGRSVQRGSFLPPLGREERQEHDREEGPDERQKRPEGLFRAKPVGTAVGGSGRGEDEEQSGEPDRGLGHEVAGLSDPGGPVKPRPDRAAPWLRAPGSRGTGA